MHRPCAMSRRAPRWVELAQDVLAMTLMLIGFGGLTVICIALVPA